MSDKATAMVDVVIPVFNGEAFVGDAIRSVLQQDFPPGAIYVVDDGSTDGTLSVLRQFGDRICVLRHMSNKGLPAARNTGIVHGKGEFIAFLDADDEWLPSKLRDQMPAFIEHPEIGLTYTACMECDAELAPVKMRRNRRRNCEWVFGELYLNAFPIPPSTVIIRRDVVRECGLFDPTMLKAQDFEYWLRVSMKYPISCIPEILCLRRGNPLSITRQSTAERDVYFGFRAFDLCGSAATAWGVHLPMHVEARKILFLKRRLLKSIDVGLNEQAAYYRSRLADIGQIGLADTILLTWRRIAAEGRRFAYHLLGGPSR